MTGLLPSLVLALAVSVVPAGQRNSAAEVRTCQSSVSFITARVPKALILANNQSPSSPQDVIREMVAKSSGDE